MSRKMKALRKIHIGADTWKWYLRGQRGNLIIFTPNRKREEIPLERFIEFLGDDPDYEIDNIAYTIYPADVKRFIEQNLIKQIMESYV